MTFTELKLIEPLCRAITADKYETPTPIQAASIPHLLTGGDLLGSAQTGTGKTASFALPVLHHLAKTGRGPRRGEVRALVLTPTRELAVQVAHAFRTYGRFTKSKYAVVYGGVGYSPQIHALQNGVDVLVATPGRLLDLFHQRHLNLEKVQFLVLDEADRMLDMGFKKDIEAITEQLPKERQTILFSATIPPDIEKLAKAVLYKPKRINVSPPTMTAQNIDEKVMFVHSDNKNALLFKLLRSQDIERVLIFTRTKHVAERLQKKLNTKSVRAEAIHGNKTQNARQRSLSNFRTGRIRVLVATDVAARGIDVDGISHVINYQLSDEPENYVHRIGRTARAGKSGTAVTLCDSGESSLLRSVERFLKRKITVEDDPDYHDADIAAKHLRGKGSPNYGRRRGQHNSGDSKTWRKFRRGKHYGRSRRRTTAPNRVS